MDDHRPPTPTDAAADAPDPSRPASEPRKAKWTWTGPGAGRASPRHPCPICGGTSNCSWAAEGAVICRRTVEIPPGVGTRKGQSPLAPSSNSGQALGYLPGSKRTTSGGDIHRVWLPVDAEGRPVRAPVVSAEEYARRVALEEGRQRAKLAAVKAWWVRLAGQDGSGGQHDPRVRAWLASRGILPAWLDEAVGAGKLPVTLRATDAPPERVLVEGPAAGGVDVWAPPRAELARHWGRRSFGLVCVPRNHYPSGSDPLAQVDAGEGLGVVRGLHATYLLERADGTVGKRPEADDSAKRSAIAGPSRRTHGPCDGYVELSRHPAAGSGFEDDPAAGLVVLGEGLETMAACLVALRSSQGLGSGDDAPPPNVLACLVAGNLGKVHLPPELARQPGGGVGGGAGAGGLGGVHTIVIAGDLDQVVDSRGGRGGALTGQRKAYAAAAVLRERYPWATVVCKFPSSAVAPELVGFALCDSPDWPAGLEDADDGPLAPMIAEQTVGRERGCDLPLNRAAGGGVDWNDVITLGGKPGVGEDGRGRVAVGLLGGVDLEANRARAINWRPAATNASANVGTRPLGSSQGVRGDGGDDRDGGGGGGSGDGGGAATTGEQPSEGDGEGGGDGRFWGAPLFGGLVYYRRDLDGGAGVQLVSDRGIDRARLFLLQRCRVPGSRRFGLVYWGGVFWVYLVKRGAWRRCEPERLAGIVRTWLRGLSMVKNGRDGEVIVPVNPHSKAVSEVVEALKGEVFFASESMPAWLPPNIDPAGVPMFGAAVDLGSIDDREASAERGEARDWIVDAAGAFRLSELIDVYAGRRKAETVKRRPPMPELFTISARPYLVPLEEVVRCCAAREWDDGLLARLAPNWARVLGDMVEDSARIGGEAGLEAVQRRVDALGAMFGDTVSGDRSGEWIFMLPGPRRSGKGIILQGLYAVLGSDAIATTSFARISTPYGLTTLVGRSAAVMTDAHVSQFTDATSAVEHLKSIRGNDPVTIERKYGDEIPNVHLCCRFWIFCNDEPASLSDNSGAFSGSLVVWPMTRSFYGAEDPRLKQRVREEGPGICAWALYHAARLFSMERPSIQQPGEAASVLKEIEASSSPMQAFLEEVCVGVDDPQRPGKNVVRFDPEATVLFDALYGVYTRWMEREGKARFAIGRNKLTGRIRSIVPGIETKQPTNGERGRRIVVGIRLRDDLDQELSGVPVAGSVFPPAHKRADGDEQMDLPV